MQEYTATIQGEVLEIRTTTFKGSDGKDVTSKKALLVFYIDKEPFKNEVPVPRDEDWKEGEKVEAIYRIYPTKFGLYAKPI